MKRSLQSIILLIFLPLALSAEGSGDTVRAIYVDNSNVKWFGSDLGLLSFNGETWKAYYTRQNTPGNVSSLMFRNTGSEFWVGTDDGVMVGTYDNSDFTSGVRYSTINTEKHDQVRSNVVVKEDNMKIDLTNVKEILSDNSQNIYIELDSGLAVLQGSKWIWLDIGYGIADHGVPLRPLITIGAEADTVYIGAKSVGAGRLYPDVLKVGYYEGGENPTLVITEEDIDAFAGASLYAPPYVPIIHEKVTSIFTDSQGYQWFGTPYGVCQHTEIASKQGWDVRLTTSDGLVNNQVNAIFEDSNGEFWFATNGGVSKYTPDGALFTNYTTSDGLPDNMVFDIAEDHDNILWFATAKGVSSFDGLAFTNYSTAEHAKDFVTISGVGIKALNLPEQARLKVYPNPASDQAYVHFMKETDMLLDVMVYDISGKQVQSLFSGYSGGGDLKVRWNLTNKRHEQVSSGIYFISIESQNFRITRKVVVLR